MRTLFTAVASALLLAAAVTELSSRLWPDNYLALLVLAAVALLINGLFNARLAGVGAAAPAQPQPRAQPRPQPQTDSIRHDKRTNERSQPGDKRAAAARPAAATSSADAGGERESGTVKWFNRSKGFGFIIRGNGEEVFVHQRSVRMTGEDDERRRPTLRDGQQVTFTVVARDKGAQAEDVAPVDD